MTGPSLVLGFGCERGIRSEAVVQGINGLLDRYDRSIEQVDFIASIDLKDDEQGLLDAAESLGVDLRFFGVDRLRTVTPPNPNPVVEEAVGVAGVAETAALVASGSEILLHEKTILHPRDKGMTVAIADGTDRK